MVKTKEMLKFVERGQDVKNSEVLNQVLVDIFRDIIDVEETVLIKEGFSDISINDIHIIEAVGIEELKNMSCIARELSVTVGTLTIAINQLVKKNYVERMKSEVDRRQVLISLTEKGRYAYEQHQQFHQKMIYDVMAGTSEEQIDILLVTLIKLRDSLNGYKAL